MRTAPVYYLSFSTRRLVALLEDAGFVVAPPPDLSGAVVRFVSEPGEERVGLQVLMASGEWADRTGRRVERPAEDIPAGRYL